MVIRPYDPADCEILAQLFYHAVHSTRAYTKAQQNAWAPQVPQGWNEGFLANHTVVAEKAGQLIGFGDMDESGYLDRLYVHPAYQRKGVATALCDALETASSAERFLTHASLDAKPFFEARGYRVIRQQQVERCGILLTNFVMTKERRQKYADRKTSK